MRVVYSTLEVDLVSEMMDNQDDLVELYQQAKHVGKLGNRFFYTNSFYICRQKEKIIERIISRTIE